MSDASPLPLRRSVRERHTRETRIACRLDLDGGGRGEIATGIAFLDHMLLSLVTHARLDLVLRCEGDLAVDDHHSVEDCAIVLGEAIDAALGDKRAVARFGHAYAPLDDALARAVLDLSGRPYARVALGLRRERLGTLSCENIPHFFHTLAMRARLTLHLEVLCGDNDHHRTEAAFKAFALALRAAIARTPDTEIPSTKGVL